jgi:hypothetical protein
MLDINGQELRERDLVQILCEIVELDPNEGVKVRILNSEQELLVTLQQDEVLGGLVASSELSKFIPSPAPCLMPLAGDYPESDDDYRKSAAGIAESMAEMMLDSQADGIKTWPME